MGPRSSRREEQRNRDRRGWASFHLFFSRMARLVGCPPMIGAKAPAGSDGLPLPPFWLVNVMATMQQWRKSEVRLRPTGLPASTRPRFCFLSPTPTVRSSRRLAAAGRSSCVLGSGSFRSGAPFFKGRSEGWRGFLSLFSFLVGRAGLESRSVRGCVGSGGLHPGPAPLPRGDAGQLEVSALRGGEAGLVGPFGKAEYRSPPMA